MVNTVHAICYAAQGDLEFRCDNFQDEVAWGKEAEKAKLPLGIMLAESGRLYTWNESQVTCKICLNKE